MMEPDISQQQKFKICLLENKIPESQKSLIFGDFVIKMGKNGSRESRKTIDKSVDTCIIIKVLYVDSGQMYLVSASDIRCLIALFWL